MKKRDIMILAAVLAVAGVFLAAGYLISHQGAEDRVNIYVGNQLFESVLLTEDRVVAVEQDGGYSNHVEIKDGVVRMLDSNCANQDCLQMGAMSAENPGLRFGSIVCLPHQVTVELRLANEELG